MEYSVLCVKLLNCFCVRNSWYTVWKNQNVQLMKLKICESNIGNDWLRIQRRRFILLDY